MPAPPSFAKIRHFVRYHVVPDTIAIVSRRQREWNKYVRSAEFRGEPWDGPWFCVRDWVSEDDGRLLYCATQHPTKQDAEATREEFIGYHKQFGLPKPCHVTDKDPRVYWRRKAALKRIYADERYA